LDSSLPSDEDPVLRRLQNKPPVERYGEYASYSLLMAYREMQYLDRDQLLTVRFEDLTGNPHGTLARISDFFELPPGGDWIDRAASKINRSVPTRADRLPAEERKRLEAGCRIGQLLEERDPGVSPVTELNRKLTALYRKEAAQS
jgi:hypothetical protein